MENIKDVQPECYQSTIKNRENKVLTIEKWLGNV
jgi:hypothetical protein